MGLLRRLYGKLRLQINESKSAVASAFGRKFLGYEFWMAPGDEVKRAASHKACETFRPNVRWLTRRNGGRSFSEVIDGLRPYVLGWKAYFSLAQTPSVWRKLDEWMRHRMRAIQLKHWRRGRTIYRELLALGAPEPVARKTAANSRRWWSNSYRSLNAALSVRYFDRLGMPRLS